MFSGVLEIFVAALVDPLLHHGRTNALVKPA
jgi:hypothetical protein